MSLYQVYFFIALIINALKRKYDLENLISDYKSGKKFKYLKFWGHRKTLGGEITNSCFSQWYNQNFEVDGISYPTAENYMMAEKARLFNDNDAEQKILNSNSPGNAKSIGRMVKNFDQKIWDANRVSIVVKGNFNKFSQNFKLKEYLINTQKRVLVEASPVDTIWGIGLDRESEFSEVPVKWRGLNLLGFALMEVRDELDS